METEDFRGLTIEYDGKSKDKYETIKDRIERAVHKIEKSANKSTNCYNHIKYDIKNLPYMSFYMRIEDGVAQIGFFDSKTKKLHQQISLHYAQKYLTNDVLKQFARRMLSTIETKQKLSFTSLKTALDSNDVSSKILRTPGEAIMRGRRTNRKNPKLENT